MWIWQEGYQHLDKEQGFDWLAKVSNMVPLMTRGISVRIPTVGCKSFGRNIRLGFKQQQQDLIYNHLCLRK